jgi:signal transduction histidine kinase/ActR/RegA family two-component response regulator
LNPLLTRQLRKHLPQLDPADASWKNFLQAVGAAYDGFQADHAFVERTLEVTSEELTEANERLRRESETRLASISRYYEQTLELQQGMILCLVQAPGGFRYTLCRGQLLHRLGWASPAEIEGKYVEDAAGAEQAKRLNAAFQRVWNGEEVSLSYATVDGIELFALMRPRIENGVVCEIVAACVEVTALKDAERELRAAKERAEAADRAKSEFLAVMSHEIRTPLNAVLGFSDMLRESPLTPEQKSRVEVICNAGESLLGLIDDILDFSKIEAGQLSLHPEPLALPTMLDVVTSLFQARAVAKGLVLKSEIAPEVPSHVEVDIHRLRQILVNLVGNALKFTAQGTIGVSVQLAGPLVAGEPCLLRFAVTDTGIGIPADRRDRLFKPFSQVDSSTTRHYGGTGLGLAISARLARLLGGEIGFDSELGRGSTFYFTVRVPVIELRPVNLDVLPVSAVPVALANPHLRILVAEDQPQNRMLIEDYLLDRGFHPDLVENGRLAIEAAKAKTYDLILMDLLMPEVDGYEAARAILAHFSDGSRPRIVALTANVFPEDRERCRAVGMNGLLTKPINFRQLDRVLAGAEPDIE